MQNAAPMPACPAGSATYRWRVGDTIARVAAAHNTTEQAIRHLNRTVDFNRMAPGMIICMPPRHMTCPNGVLYTARVGDSFASIARAFGITAAALTNANPYVDPRTLRAGQILCVPNRPPTGMTPTVPPIRPPAPPPPVRPCPAGFSTMRVAFGQTLGNILMLHNLSFRTFQLANPGVDITRLVPGQSYCVPPAISPASCPNGTFYTIRAGENLSSIAASTRRSVESILQANPTLAPSDFAVGRRVCIPR